MAKRADDDDKAVNYRYTFSFEDGSEKTFEVHLDYETLAMTAPPREDLPEWTALEFHQCSNCPLDPATHPRCPVAVNVVDLIEYFRSARSFDEVDVKVESRNRAYSAHTSQQRGVAGLLGIIMVTSGCPIMDRLRPMVDTHLPFMNLEESTYRIISMYLTAQYFKYRRGGTPDWDLQGLLTFLQETHDVNTGFTDRLRSIRIQDASLNAVVNLNTSSSFITIAMQSDWLNRFEQIFLDHAGWAADEIEKRVKDEGAQ